LGERLCFWRVSEPVSDAPFGAPLIPYSEVTAEEKEKPHHAEVRLWFGAYLIIRFQCTKNKTDGGPVYSVM